MSSFNIAIIHHVLLAVFLTTFTACQSDRRLDALDESGENRPELEKVLQHYKDDEQKLPVIDTKFIKDCRLNIRFPNQSEFPFSWNKETGTHFLPILINIRHLCCVAHAFISYGIG